MTSSPFRLDGKTILITGASSGIGRAVAIECANLGASCCILVARNKENLQATANLIAPTCHTVIKECDLTDSESVINMVTDLPVLDGAVCNAGTNRMQLIQFCDETEIERIFKINCFSPMILVKHLVKKKKLAKFSSVVFTASISGATNVSLAHSIYGSSKSALSAFMKYAALEFAPKRIRFNAVHPGRVETPLIHKFSDDDAIRTDLARYPLGRYAQPQEIAYAIIYFLSDASSWVTGSSLVIDGGRSLT